MSNEIKLLVSKKIAGIFRSVDRELWLGNGGSMVMTREQIEAYKGAIESQLRMEMSQLPEDRYADHIAAFKRQLASIEKAIVKAGA